MALFDGEPLADEEFQRAPAEAQAAYAVSGVLHWRTSGQEYRWHFQSEEQKRAFAEKFAAFAMMQEDFSTGG